MYLFVMYVCMHVCVCVCDRELACIHLIVLNRCSCRVMEELPRQCNYQALGAARIREIKSIVAKLGESVAYLIV